jgi:hypothetical protein
MITLHWIEKEKVWKLGDNCIHQTNEYKYMGVYVTRTLKSNYHVQTYIKDNMDNKINFMSRILDRFSPKLDKKSHFRHIHLCFHYDLRRSKLYAT